MVSHFIVLSRVDPIRFGATDLSMSGKYRDTELNPRDGTQLIFYKITEQPG